MRGGTSCRAVPRGGNRGAGMADHELRRVGAREGRLSRQHFVQHATERVLVGPAVHVIPPRGLLRSHVQRSTHDHPVSRFSTPGIPFADNRVRPAGLRDPRNAKVRDQREPVREQNIFGLHVTMDDPLGMGVLKGAGNLVDQPEGLLQRQVLLAHQPRTQGIVFDVRHHVIQLPAVGAGIMQRQDVRMRQLRGDVDLAQKAIVSDGRGDLGLHDLERDPAAMLRIVRQVDRGHASGGDPSNDAVAPDLAPLRHAFGNSQRVTGVGKDPRIPEQTLCRRQGKEQGLHFGPNFGVLSTGAVQVRGPLLRRQRPRASKDLRRVRDRIGFAHTRNPWSGVPTCLQGIFTTAPYARFGVATGQHVRSLPRPDSITRGRPGPPNSGAGSRQRLPGFRRPAACPAYGVGRYSGRGGRAGPNRTCRLPGC